MMKLFGCYINEKQNLFYTVKNSEHIHSLNTDFSNITKTKLFTKSNQYINYLFTYMQVHKSEYFRIKAKIGDCINCKTQVVSF